MDLEWDHMDSGVRPHWVRWVAALGRVAWINGVVEGPRDFACDWSLVAGVVDHVSLLITP